jgi:hypothetical protein
LYAQGEREQREDLATEVGQAERGEGIARLADLVSGHAAT